MTNLMLYALALGLLLASYLKDREKTRKSLKKSLKSVENILPQISSSSPWWGFFWRI